MRLKRKLSNDFVKILPVIVTTTNKVHRYSKHSGSQNFWSFIILKSMESATLIFVTPSLGYCLYVEAVMTAVLCHHSVNHTNIIIVSVLA